MRQVAITTVDNPYDPFDQFKEWYTWDMNANYHTPSLLARLVDSSYELSEADQLVALENAIDEMLQENVTGMYRKLVKDSG
jgi:hypothetical protein